MPDSGTRKRNLRSGTIPICCGSSTDAGKVSVPFPYPHYNSDYTLPYRLSFKADLENCYCARCNMRDDEKDGYWFMTICHGFYQDLF